MHERAGPAGRCTLPGLEAAEALRRYLTPDDRSQAIWNAKLQAVTKPERLTVRAVAMLHVEIDPNAMADRVETRPAE